MTSPPRQWPLGLRLLAVGAICVLAAVCLSCFPTFQPVVGEEMEIVFHDDGGAEVTLVTTLRVLDPNDADPHPAVDARLREVRESIARRDDLWARNVDAIRPEYSRETFEYEEGILHTASRSARVDPEALRSIFLGAPLSVLLDLNERDQTVRLEFAPSGESRASERQERNVRDALRGFCAEIAGYHAAVADLYRELGDAPYRARACFENLLEDLVPEEDRRRVALDERESRLVRALAERMGRIWSVLGLVEDEAYTLDELSHLVYDPFPARLEIEVAGTVEEVEGFERRSDRRVAVPELGLLGALVSLRERWVVPDPVPLYVEEARREGGPRLDLDGLAARPRLVRRLPGPDEVCEAIEERLRPAASYRLTWRPPAWDDEPAP